MRTLYHRIELTVGVAMVLVSPLAGRFLPSVIDIHVADVFRWSGILILGQSLVRDVVLLVFYRDLIQGKPVHGGLLICLESTLGAGLIGVYLALYLMGAEGWIHLDARLATLITGLIWLFGYFSRDVVLEMRRDPNHLNLVLGFR